MAIEVPEIVLDDTPPGSRRGRRGGVLAVSTLAMGLGAAPTYLVGLLGRSSAPTSPSAGHSSACSSASSTARPDPRRWSRPG